METEHSPLIVARGVRLIEKLGYGLGHIQNDLSAAIWFTYSLVFYQLVASSGPLLSGVLVFVGQGVDAVATPVAGYLVDRTSYSRRTWHMIGSIISSLSFPMMFTLCSFCGIRTWYQGLYYSIFISMFQCGWAIVQIAHLSILPEMAKSSRDRAELTAYRYSATMISNIAVYLIALVYFYNLKSESETSVGPSDASTFQKIALTVNAVGIVTTAAFLGLGKPRGNATRLQSEEEMRAEAARLEVSRWWDVCIIAGVYTTSRLFLTLTMEYLPLYIDRVVLATSQALATVPLVLFLSSALASFLYQRFDSCIGQKWTYFIGCLSCLAGCVIVFFNSEKTTYPKNVFVAAALFGGGSAFTMVISLSLAANLIGAQVERGAFVYSTVTFADKLINGIAVVLIQYLGCSDQELCPNFYRDVLACLNGVTIIIGYAFFLALPSRLFKTAAPAH